MRIAEELPRLGPGASFAGPEFAGCSSTGRRPVIKNPAVRSAGGRLESCGWILVGDAIECDLGLWGRADFEWFLGPRRGRHPSRRLWKFRGRAAAVARMQALVDEVLRFNAEVARERVASRGRFRAAVAAGDAAWAVEAVLAMADVR